MILSLSGMRRLKKDFLKVMGHSRYNDNTPESALIIRRKGYSVVVLVRNKQIQSGFIIIEALKMNLAQ